MPYLQKCYVCYLYSEAQGVTGTSFTGQIIFDATGQVDIQGVQEISEALVDGLIRLGKEQNVSQLQASECCAIYSKFYFEESFWRKETHSWTNWKFTGQ